MGEDSISVISHIPSEQLSTMGMSSVLLSNARPWSQRYCDPLYLFSYSRRFETMPMTS